MSDSSIMKLQHNEYFSIMYIEKIEVHDTQDTECGQQAIGFRYSSPILAIYRSVKEVAGLFEYASDSCGDLVILRATLTQWDCNAKFEVMDIRNVRYWEEDGEDDSGWYSIPQHELCYGQIKTDEIKKCEVVDFEDFKELKRLYENRRFVYTKNGIPRKFEYNEEQKCVWICCLEEFRCGDQYYYDEGITLNSITEIIQYIKDVEASIDNTSQSED